MNLKALAASVILTGATVFGGLPAEARPSTCWFGPETGYLDAFNCDVSKRTDSSGRPVWIINVNGTVTHVWLYHDEYTELPTYAEVLFDGEAHRTRAGWYIDDANDIRLVLNGEEFAFRR